MAFIGLAGKEFSNIRRDLEGGHIDEKQALTKLLLALEQFTQGLPDEIVDVIEDWEQRRKARGGR